MQIRLSSVLVDDQEKALRFYTTVLGFVKDKDIPTGPFRWLTVNRRKARKVWNWFWSR
jgi:catechol 2,3-dioxygenase-like lactoylglutathione lyase family enzyme